jgi:hypothetical protein
VSNRICGKGFGNLSLWVLPQISGITICISSDFCVFLPKTKKMDSIVIDLNSNEDKKIFISLAKRLNLKARFLTQSEKEDIGLANAIDMGRESGYVDEDKVIYTLRKQKSK